jgi:hypothetical protein
VIGDWLTCVTSDQGAARRAGTNTSVASGCAQDTSAATWLQA